MKNICKIIAFSLLVCITLTACNFNINKEGSYKAPIDLPLNKWENSSISPGKDRAGVQWFKIVATASSHRVYVKLNTLDNMNIYICNSLREQIGSKHNYYGNTGSVFYSELQTEVGEVYYIKAEGSYLNSSGSFFIGFTDFPAQPESVITELNENHWTNGNIISSINGGTGEQWFKFTATAATQYIYVKYSTCTSMDIYVYDLFMNQIGSRFDADANFSGAIHYIQRNLIAGETYYIKADYGSGTFWIGFTDFPAAPETNIPVLCKNKWEQGNIISQQEGGLGEQWFKFVATDFTQNIFVKFSTCTSMDVYIYDSKCNLIGNRFDADGKSPGDISKASWVLNVGETYYILVNYGTGSFWIAYGTSGELHN